MTTEMGWAGSVAQLQYNGMPNVRMERRRSVDVGRSFYPHHASGLVVTTSTVPKPNEVNDLDTDIAPSANNL
jgi:hypothetical protein